MPRIARNRGHAAIATRNQQRSVKQRAYLRSIMPEAEAKHAQGWSRQAIADHYHIDIRAYRAERKAMGLPMGQRVDQPKAPKDPKTLSPARIQKTFPVMNLNNPPNTPDPPLRPRWKVRTVEEFSAEELARLHEKLQHWVSQ